MSTSDPLTRLFHAARNISPFGEPSDFGFETRLRAALGSRGPTLSESIARLSWRFSAASLPILLGIAIFLAATQRSFPPAGIGDLVSQWASWLPVDI